MVVRFDTRFAFVLSAALIAGGVRPAGAVPLGTAFTYQGQLQQSGSPANGTCDFQLSLFDTSSGGTQLGSTQTLSPVSVSNGLFTVQVNDSGQFGASAFDGSDRWLQIAVRCPVGSGSYAMLTPRQQLTATPYALYAPAAGSASSVTCTGCVSTSNLGPGAVTDQKVASGIAYSKLSGAPTALPPNGPAGGSLSGTYPNPALAANAVGTAQIQNGAVTSTKLAATVGDIMSVIAGTGLSGGGPSGDVTLSVNFAGSGSAGTTSRSDHDHAGQTWMTAAPTGLQVESTALSGSGLVGRANSGPNPYGVWGVSNAGKGVHGDSTTGTGVEGTSPSGAGVQGMSSGGNGVEGLSTTGDGMHGVSTSGPGVHGLSTGGNGVLGENTSSTNAAVSALNRSVSGLGYGIYAETRSTDFAAAGVHGVALGSSGQVIGVEGVANSSTGGAGIVGRGGGVGGYFENTNDANSAVVSINHSPSGNAANGVYGETSSNGFNVAGVEGVATADNGNVVGVRGTANSPSGSAIVGEGGVGTGGFFRGSAHALYADGNAAQARDKGGWVKAMANVNPYVAGTNNEQIVGCFNSQVSDATVATTPPCGFTYNSPLVGYYEIDFGFNVYDRFVSVQPVNPGACVVPSLLSTNSVNKWGVQILLCSGDVSAANQFYIIVY